MNKRNSIIFSFLMGVVCVVVVGKSIAFVDEKESDLTMQAMEAKMYHELLVACESGVDLMINNKIYQCVDKH